MHGPGEYTNLQGETKKGVWENGKRLKAKKWI